MVLRPLHNIFSEFVQKLAQDMVRGLQLNQLQFGGRQDRRVRLADLWVHPVQLVKRDRSVQSALLVQLALQAQFQAQFQVLLVRLEVPVQLALQALSQALFQDQLVRLEIPVQMDSPDPLVQLDSEDKPDNPGKLVQPVQQDIQDILDQQDLLDSTV
jgi:hypothetical protein